VSQAGREGGGVSEKVRQSEEEAEMWLFSRTLSEGTGGRLDKHNIMLIIIEIENEQQSGTSAELASRLHCIPPS